MQAFLEARLNRQFALTHESGMTSGKSEGQRKRDARSGNHGLGVTLLSEVEGGADQSRLCQPHETKDLTKLRSAFPKMSGVQDAI